MMSQEDQFFTLDQIHAAFKKVKSGADFPQWVQDLKALGVIYYDNEVADGRTTYVGAKDWSISDSPKYPTIKVQENSSSDKLKHAMSIHQQGKTDYPTFCFDAAQAGVERWRTHR